MPRKKLLVFGANGLLGLSLLRYFSCYVDIDALGVVRDKASKVALLSQFKSNMFCEYNFSDDESLNQLFKKIRPQIVINCVGIIKQATKGADPIALISYNSLFPHQLAKACETFEVRLIHFSTDCVFSGNQGEYRECCSPDATDLYGRSKLLGEVNYPNAVTLRTSLIGNELNSARSLVSWFLSQEGSVKGYRRAIFSGLPTVEIARVLHKFVLPNQDLRGVYHLSVDPINKFDLLSLVAKVYNKNIDIIPDDTVVIDRSLDSTRFREATGFKPKPWPQLIQEMHDFR